MVLLPDCTKVHTWSTFVHCAYVVYVYSTRHPCHSRLKWCVTARVRLSRYRLSTHGAHGNSFDRGNSVISIYAESWERLEGVWPVLCWFYFILCCWRMCPVVLFICQMIHCRWFESCNLVLTRVDKCSHSCTSATNHYFTCAVSFANLDFDKSKLLLSVSDFYLLSSKVKSDFPSLALLFMPNNGPQVWHIHYLAPINFVFIILICDPFYLELTLTGNEQILKYLCHVIWKG